MVFVLGEKGVQDLIAMRSNLDEKMTLGSVRAGGAADQTD